VTVVELAVGYAAVGTILALAAAASRRATAVDAVLLVGLWPLYGPVLISAGAGRADPRGEVLELQGRVVQARTRLAAAERALARDAAELERVGDLVTRLTAQLEVEDVAGQLPE
jgi:hypothetical protein